MATIKYKDTGGVWQTAGTPTSLYTYSYDGTNKIHILTGSGIFGQVEFLTQYVSSTDTITVNGTTVTGIYLGGLIAQTLRPSFYSFMYNGSNLYFQTSAIYNSLDQTSSGFALDARQGKTLNDAKSDKVTSPTNGNFAALNSTGNLTDSGHKHSDYATSAQGVPTGGTTGQALVKSSATDYATAWAAVGRTNPNLLINWDFRDPVNERNISAFTVNSYGLDMWVLWSGGHETCTVSSGYIALNGYLSQKFERGLYPGNYTVSAMVGGAISSTQLVFDGTNNVQAYIGATGILAIIEASAGRSALHLRTEANVNIQACKLEIGRASTFANDPVADFGVELAKCQRFRSRTLMVRTMASSPAELYYGSIAFPVKARLATPTVTVVSFAGTANCVSEWNGSAFVDKAAIATDISAYGATVYSNTNALTTGSIVLFYLVQNSEL